jgi:8-amino-7-oxononanoate synthase
MGDDNTGWLRELELELEEAESAGMLRTRRICGGASNPEMELDGQATVQFASNNYLGLTTHPRVLAAAKAALEQYGTGAGASRLVGGGSLAVHAELEDALAAFKGQPAALVYATGSMANMGLLSGLCGDKDLLVLDKACHATLYDGALLSGAELRRFPHQDLSRLDALLAKERPGKRRVVVAVEGVYSMDGDIAPLPELLKVARKHRALVVVDEAHSTGVLGAGGRGILEHFGLGPQPDVILCGTLSKALASLGGFVAGPRVLIETLVNRSRSFIYATALPASAAAAALEALRVIQSEPIHLQKLRERRQELTDGLTALEWSYGASLSPILPILVGKAADAVILEERLRREGYYVPAMRPPTVPAAACRLRLSVSARHSAEQVRLFLRALGEKPC